MNSVTTVLLIALSTGLSVANAADDTAQQKLMQKLQSLQSFHAEFEQKVVDVDDNLVHQAAGTITLAQPNKLRWHTTEPDEIMLIADGESVYQTDYFVEQVSIINQSAAVNDNPMMLLTSNDSDDWNKFEVNQSGEGFVIKAKQQGPIVSLTLVYDGDMLTNIVSVDSQQQESQLRFTQQSQNKPLALDTFEPSLPAGFIIDDQRQ